MGNKRKASLILLVFAAVIFTVFPLFADYFFNLQTYGKTYGAATAKNFSSSGVICSSSEASFRGNNAYSVTLNPNRVYVVAYAGQNGEGGTGNGCGAACLGFIKTTDSVNSFNARIGHTNKKTVGLINLSDGQGYYDGGGATTVEGLNFAGATSDSTFWAAGGGGGYKRYNSDWMFTPSTSWTSATFDGYSTQPGTSNAETYIGYPATQDGAGSQGRNGSIGSAGVIRTVYLRYTVWDGVTQGSYNAKTDGTCQSSGGGVGYYNGGGGPGYYLPSKSSTYNNAYVYSAGEYSQSRSVHPGGGGICSSTLAGCYGYSEFVSTSGLTWLGTTHSGGSGYVAVADITPDASNYPQGSTGAGTQSVVAGTDPEQNISTIASGGNLSKNGFASKWIYSADGKTWYESVDDEGIQQSAIGDKTIYCKYVLYGSKTKYTEAWQVGTSGKVNGASDASVDTNFVIAETQVTLKKTGVASVTKAPTDKAPTFNGSAQSIINAGTAANGTMQYSLDKSTWYTNASDIKGTNADSYIVYYKAAGNTYTTDSDIYSMTAQIKRAIPQLGPGTLAPIKGKIYNAAGQSLWTGGATRSGNGVVYYADVWTTDVINTAANVPEPIKENSDVIDTYGTDGTTLLSNVTGVDAYSSNVQVKRYLWYRVAQGTNHSAVGWTLLVDSSGAPVCNWIEPATLSVVPTMIPERNYDGATHQLIQSVKFDSDSTQANIQSNFDITYQVVGSYADGKQSRTQSSSVYTELVGSTAANFTVAVSWTPKNNNRNYVAGTSTGTYSTKIKRISDASRINVSGITIDRNLALPVNGACKPFTEVSVDLTVNSYSTDNGITTNNGVSDINTSIEINNLSYCLSQSTTMPAAGEFITTTSAADLNNKLLNIDTVNKSGPWYLYFRVESHFNIEADTCFKALEFTIGGVTLSPEHLDGIVMSDACIYNGDSHVVATGELISNIGVTLKNVKYAVIRSEEQAPSADSNSWKTSLEDDVFKVTDQGTYKLLVRWETNEQVLGNGGMEYGTFQINQYGLNGEFEKNIYFSGHDFSTWGTPQLIGTSIVNYAQVFKNDDYEIGSMANPTVHLTTNSKITTEQFGNILFAVSDSDTDAPRPGEYVTVDKFNTLKVKNVDMYYLWVEWDGSHNVASGSMVYTYKEDDIFYTPIFLIQQLTANDGVTLVDEDFANAKEGLKYAYNFDMNAGMATGIAQPLFDSGTTNPAINVYGKFYDANFVTNKDNSIKFAVEPIGRDATVELSDWKNNIADVKATNADTYFLWVKITVSEPNVKMTKIFKFPTSAVIQKVTAFAKYEPTPKSEDELVYSGVPESLLAMGSKQTIPAVQYSLSSDPDGEWFDYYLDVKATDVGSYKVYYRGKGDGVNFTDQIDQAQIELQCISVVINASQDYYAITPKKIDVEEHYTGKGIDNSLLFTEGFAKNDVRDDFPLEYRWSDESEDVWYSYLDLPKKTNAGTHTVCYRPDPDENSNFAGAEISMLNVTIFKTKINFGALTTYGGDLIYKADDYQLLLHEMDYGLADWENGETLKNENGLSLTYQNRNDEKWTGGELSTLLYGLSTDDNEHPVDWVSDFTQIKARKVGQYYIWAKVADGQNFIGDIKCLNHEAVNIIPSQSHYTESDFEYEGIVVTGSTYKTIEGLRYTGELQNLIKEVNLVIAVPNRDNENQLLDENGNRATSASSIKYNIVPSTDSVGSIYYRLGNTDIDFPVSDNDTSENGWKFNNYLTLAKVDAANYYLQVLFLSDTDTQSNIGTAKYNLTTDDLAEIRIAPALKSDIKLSNISVENKIYNGQPQSIAVGTLVALSRQSNINFIETCQITDQQYCYVRKDDDLPTLDANWTDFANTKVTNVAEYQLYVKLTTTENIDNSEPLIYPVLFDIYGNEIYTQIMPINSSNLVKFDRPVMFTTLTYNGEAQNLIEKGANLLLPNGDELFGRIGTATYYISEDPNDVPDSSENFYLLDQAKQTNAKTYYIWVNFAEGDSHIAMGPFFAGSVIIGQASFDNIDLSGLNFVESYYNGEYHNLVSGEVIQTFKTSGKVLEIGADKDFSKIEYAISTSPEGYDADVIWFDQTEFTNMKVVDAGNYYIWVRVTGNDNVANYTTCYSKQEYAKINRATLNKENIKGVDSHTRLVYIAQEQSIASISDKVKIVLSESDTDLNTDTYNPDLSINWGLGSNENQSGEPTRWYNDLNQLKVIDSGNYYLWIWIPECNNINEYKVCYDIINIEKGTLHFTQKPGYYDDLVYNGNYQNLLSDLPVVKFHAVGEYYNPEVPYYEANSLVIEFANGDGDTVTWLPNYLDIKALNAGTYTVRYRVQTKDSDNWYPAEDEFEVSISAADSSTEWVGLTEAPKALPNLAYNEKEQDLISFGVLSNALPVEGCGAALEGCEIVFYYPEDNNPNVPDDIKGIFYRYYYNSESGEYVWGQTGKLPGCEKAGDYIVKYYVTASSKTSNFKRSDDKELLITINKREIYWQTNPEAIYGLKFTSNEQVIITPGVLNVGGTNPCTAKGVEIMYTFDEPKSAKRFWQPNLPTVQAPDLWYIWYRVEVDENNVFVGDENNDKAMGEMIVVYIERHILTIRDLPNSETLQYTAEEQSLVNYYYLSTDSVHGLGDNAPYFEYSFTKNAPDNEWTRTIKAKDVAEYTVYYRLNYNDVLFEFRGENDGHQEPMELKVVISPMVLSADSLRAIYVPDDKGGRMTYEVEKREEYNYETEEIEYLPLYSDNLLAEIEADGIQYYYRKADKYHLNDSWSLWTNGETSIKDLGIGTYEFMLSIGGSNTNFKNYTQTGDVTPLNNYTYYEDRVIEVVMKDYNTPAYVRAWIDFTNTMTYEDAEFKFEGWVNSKTGRLEIPFYNVNSTGRYDAAIIKLQTVNASYYHMSESELSKDDKLKTKLESKNLKNAIGSFNQKLKEPYKTVYLYEVYRICYDANGGIGDTLSEGWKWHKIDYLLEENKYSKTVNGEVLVANGWNTTKSGNGTNYSSGSMYYRQDASQIFYAKYFASGDNYYTIKWVIDNGSKRYELSRDSGVWFDTSNDLYASRDTGVLIAEGEMITLPQIQLDENKKSLSGIFGEYIKAWKIENEGLPYYIGMTATRNITFVAELNGDINDYVQCKFVDDQNEEVHDSGLIANGAQAYMALSGMDANLIKEYQDGYQKWVDRYQYATLDGSGKPDGVLVYDLGVKKEVVEEPNDQEVVITWDDYISMFVILGLGVATTIVSLSIYIIMRKKHHQVNLSNFKEDSAL